MRERPAVARLGRKLLGERYGAARLIILRAEGAGKEKSERARFEKRFAQREGTHIRRGPFRGMRFLKSVVGSTPMVPMLLGAYEEELHAAIEEVVAHEPGLVVDIGCAEGYYAVGLARRLPRSHVVAFDINPIARHMCRRLAGLNDVRARVEVRAECDPEFLSALCPGSFVLSDCEGAEKSLLDPDRAPALKKQRILVEVHNLTDPTVAETLKARFASSHDIEQIDARPRDPSVYRELRSYSPADAARAVSERRGDGMTWLMMRPRLT